MPAWLRLYAPIAENKKGIYKFSARFLAFSDKISTVQKKCCPRAEDRAIFEDLRLRGQGQGLEASRPRPRTSKCVLEDVLEAKDVLEDSTSAIKRVLNLNCEQRGLSWRGWANQFFQWLSYLSTLVLLNGSQKVWNLIPIVLKCLFFSKTSQKFSRGYPGVEIFSEKVSSCIGRLMIWEIVLIRDTQLGINWKYLKLEKMCFLECWIEIQVSSLAQVDTLWPYEIIFTSLC